MARARDERVGEGAKAPRSPLGDLFWLAVAAAWTALMGALGYLSVEGSDREIRNLASVAAEASFNKDLMYRRWAAERGGVYVGSSGATPPNPYLPAADRQLITADGRSLTLVNPAYMTRQVFEIGRTGYGLGSHITSLAPLRPENGPDAWEASALRAIEAGAKGSQDVATVGGRKVFRAMFPLFVEAPCLRCHGVQGYRVGQVRGGIRVDVPLEPFETAYGSFRIRALRSLGLIWATGLGSLLLARFWAGKNYRALREATEAVVAGEERFRQIVDHAGDALLLSDMEGRFVEINATACQMFGYSREEFLRLRVSDLSVGNGDREVAGVHERLGPGETVLIEDENRRKDGSLFPAEVHVTMVSLGGEKFGLGVVRDVTEQKRQRQEAEQAARRAMQAQRLEALGTLTGGIAHDFNNILAPIIGFTELVEPRLPEGSKEREYLAKVLSSASRARELVSGLLAFSRNSGDERIKIPVAAAIDEWVKVIRSTIPATIDITTSIEDVGCVMAGPVHLQQIVMNLCTNAYHAMRGSGGALRLELQGVDVDASSNPDGLRSGRYARLTVSDTGAGMDDRTMAHIFDPFFTTKEPGEGTGLGLSIVRGVVETLGGSISVESRLGRGTRFTIHLPVVGGAAAEEGASPAPAEGGGERVLVVDDESSITSLVQAMLADVGYRVEACSSAAEALARVEQEEFDLLITDQTMPGLTGLELIRRARVVSPGLRAILCTGYSDGAGEETAREAGASAFVNKPYRREALVSTVRQVLDGT